MSRQGNCLDNAPYESYFGHMKDEVNIDTCFTFRDVYNEIKEYIDYYNNFRYQWNLKKMTPVQYRSHLLTLSSFWVQFKKILAYIIIYANLLATLAITFNMKCS